MLRPRRGAHERSLLALLAFLFASSFVVGFALHLSHLPQGLSSSSVTSFSSSTSTPRANVFPAHLQTPQPSASHVRDLNNCPWIESLLRGQDPLATSEGLPKSGKLTDFGVIFWLKQPILKTVDPVSGQKVVLLKYNHYTPTQHTIKFTNTITILQEFRETGIFPDLRAYCQGAKDGFDYVLVDYVPLHPSELPAPSDFDQCLDRGLKVLELLVRLDEDLHLAFVDVKPGQWMAREGGTAFVLQDIDDVVHSPWVGEQYSDQVEDAIRRVARVNGLSKRDAFREWHSNMFPGGQLTIRYAMVRLDSMLLHDMGFGWEDKGCAKGMPAGFVKCLHGAINWGAVVGEDWPSPRQVRDEMAACGRGEQKPRQRRERREWRELAPGPVVELPWCSRAKKGDGSARAVEGAWVGWCGQGPGRQCCVEYKGDKCGVEVNESECRRGGLVG